MCVGCTLKTKDFARDFECGERAGGERDCSIGKLGGREGKEIKVDGERGWGERSEEKTCNYFL